MELTIIPPSPCGYLAVGAVILEWNVLGRIKAILGKKTFSKMPVRMFKVVINLNFSLCIWSRTPPRREAEACGPCARVCVGVF